MIILGDPTIVFIDWHVIGGPHGVVGPVSPNLDTTLTNKSAGKHFTKRQKLGLLNEIYQEGLLAKEALSRFDGMSELEVAELGLDEAEAAHSAATDKLRTSYTRRLYEDAEDADAKLTGARDRVDGLRVAEAKRKALDDAKAKIKKQVQDAIAKRRSQ